jgi:hypothetical protein
MHRYNVGREGQMPPPPIYSVPDNSYFGYRFEEGQISKVGVRMGRGLYVY